MTRDIDIASNEKIKRVHILGSCQKEICGRESVKDEVSLQVTDWLTLQ